MIKCFFFLYSDFILGRSCFYFRIGLLQGDYVQGLIVQFIRLDKNILKINLEHIKNKSGSKEYRIVMGIYMYTYVFFYFEKSLFFKARHTLF